jgi:hypothetical protein
MRTAIDVKDELLEAHFEKVPELKKYTFPEPVCRSDPGPLTSDQS